MKACLEFGIQPEPMRDAPVGTLAQPTQKAMANAYPVVYRGRWVRWRLRNCVRLRSLCA